MNKKIIKYWFYAIIGVVSFSLLPLFIDKIIMNKFTTNWDLETWGGFLGSYLGGGIGGIITLIGVWWQMTNEKKKKDKEEKLGFLKYCHYVLNKNLKFNDDLEKNKIEKEEFIKRTYNVFSYNSYSIANDQEINILLPLNQKILEEKFDYIFTLPWSKDIYELSINIIKFNNLYNYLFTNLSQKKVLLDELEKNYMNSEVDLLELLSNIIFKFSFYNEYDISCLKDAPIPDGLSADIKKIKNGSSKNTEETIKNISKTILNITKNIQQYLPMESDIRQKIGLYRIKETELYYLDIYKIFEDMEKILENIKIEISKLEN